MSASTITTPNDRLQCIDMLRGIAAMAVCWHHFTFDSPYGFLPAGWLKSSGKYGWLGVEIFFVISGFIIPYTLYRAGYQRRHYGTFLLKRILRLEPPYLVSIAALVLLSYLQTPASGGPGPPHHPSLVQILLHLGYLNTFFNFAWLNPVFWTLSIEAQYYLLIGWIFPLVAGPNLRAQVAAIAGLAVLPFVLPYNSFVFNFLHLFVMGIVTFYRRVGLIGTRLHLILLSAMTLGGGLTLGFEAALAGATTACLIAYGNFRVPRVLSWLGLVSYSLYLVHGPVGGQVVSLSLGVVDSLAGKWGVVFMAVGLSVIGATLLYYGVERPAQRWSSKIKYRPVPG